MREIKKLLAKSLRDRGLDLVADPVRNCGRRHLRDGERRRDGVSTTAEWPPPVGKAEQPRGTHSEQPRTPATSTEGAV